MTEVRKSRAASIDLDNIWYYIAAGNPHAADAYLYRLFARCEAYAHQPRLGESRPEFGRQVRCFSVEKYVFTTGRSLKASNSSECCTELVIFSNSKGAINNDLPNLILHGPLLGAMHLNKQKLTPLPRTATRDSLHP